MGLCNKRMLIYVKCLLANRRQTANDIPTIGFDIYYIIKGLLVVSVCYLF